MMNVSQIVATQGVRALGSTARVVTPSTARTIGGVFVRRYTVSARTQPPHVRPLVRRHTNQNVLRRHMSTSNRGNRPSTTDLTRTTTGRTPQTGGTGTTQRGTSTSQGPGLFSMIGTVFNALTNAFRSVTGSGPDPDSAPPRPPVSAERARQVNAYLPDDGHLPSARQRVPETTYRRYEESAQKIGNQIGVPKALADQFPPETELAMTMYQQAATEGGVVEDNQAPYPFNGRDFNQALRGDTPLAPGAGRTRDTPDTPKEKLIAGLELRVLGVPTPAGEPKVYARTLATNDHNAELIRRLNANEAVTDGGVISVSAKLDALAPSMYLVSVDNAFVNPHLAHNDLASAEAEHMAIGQVLVKIGEHNGVPVVAAYSDKAVLADAMADIGRHFSFEGDTLATSIGTQARGERADTAKALVDSDPGALLAQIRAQLPTPQPTTTAQLITPPPTTL